MTERLYVAATLRIDCGRPGREPTADYWCASCGQTESAQGTAAVIEFARTVRDAHQTRCTNPRKEPT